MPVRRVGATTRFALTIVSAGSNGPRALRRPVHAPATVGALLVNRPTGRFILRARSAGSKGCAPACPELAQRSFEVFLQFFPNWNASTSLNPCKPRFNDDIMVTRLCCYSLMPREPATRRAPPYRRRPRSLPATDPQLCPAKKTLREFLINTNGN